MHRKFGLLIILFSLLFVLASSNQNSKAETNGMATPLTTLRLSDIENTVYRTADPLVLAGTYGAHVIWSEYTAFFDDSDLFYAQLPAGTVTKLTDLSATTGLVGLYSNPQYKAVVDEFNNLYVIWSEDVGGSERQDMFFWKTGMTTPINISDHDLSNGDIGNLFIVLDSGNQAHALWAEGTLAGIFGPSIFYWSEATGVTQKLSLGSGIVGEFNVTQAYAFEIHNDVLYALWQDLDENGSGDPEPFYWNSETGVVQPIRQPGLPGSEASLNGFFFSASGVFHAFWLEKYSSTDYYYWDSATDINLQMPESIVLSKYYADGNGNGHFYYTDGGVYQFDTVSQTASLIPGLPATNNILEVGDGRIGDHFHMLWQAEDTNFPGHMNDLFYWRSDMAQPINITNHTVAPAEPTEIKMVVDETDTVHILWQEDTPFYYDSNSGLTSQPPASLNGLLIGRVASRNGIAYVEFSDFGNDPPFYIWQSNDNSITPASGSLSSGAATVAGNGVGSATSKGIWLDSNDQLHLLRDNIFHWDTVRGLQDLTLGDEMEPVDEGNGGTWVAMDSVGGSYIVWQGTRPSMDGDDLYAAFVSPELPNSIYLPIVLQQ